MLAITATAKDVEMSETPDYSTDDGKILLLHGPEIREVHLTLRDLEDTSTPAEVEHFYNVNSNSFFHKMYNPFGCDYIRYDVLVYDTLNRTFQFTGVYKTFSSQMDINYSDIQTMINQSNEKVRDDMEKLKETVVKNVSDLKNAEDNIVERIQENEEELILKVRQEGLSDSQIQEIANAIEDGYFNTERNINQRIKQAEERGFNNALQLVGIFIIIIIIAVVFWFFTRDSDKSIVSFIFGKGKKSSDGGYKDDEISDVFG